MNIFLLKGSVYKTTKKFNNSLAPNVILITNNVASLFLLKAIYQAYHSNVCHT